MRFSALGDVAMTVPVVQQFLHVNPDVEVIMLSNQQFADLFAAIPRLTFLGVDLHGKHKGIIGIFRIYNLVRKQVRFSAVADLHGVIRTHILRFLFFIVGKKTAVIDKGRDEKHALTRRDHKIFRPLTHTTERYMIVFERLGFATTQIENNAHNFLSRTNEKIRIGFAPFAKHKLKMYDLDRMKEVIRSFDKEPYEIYLFGGTVAEKMIIRDWKKHFSHVVDIPGESGLRLEIERMKTLRLMVTMDSANMHLAALTGIPVVSIWGPTHPFAGFFGYNQDPRLAIQVNNLSCRPCSVYGSRSCWRGDHACMQQIDTDMVIQKIRDVLGS